MNAALQAQLAAATALVSTMPTTMAGLQALERHLRGRRLLCRVERTVVDGDRTYDVYAAMARLIG